MTALRPVASGTFSADRAGLIACPTCDALYYESPVPIGGRASCRRCGTILDAPRERAMTRIVMMSATALILMAGAIFFPFLQISTSGMVHQASIVDVILAYSHGSILLMTLAVGVFIVLLPSVRLALIIYALAPMALGDHPPRLAIPAFRLAETIRPWAMAEIFVIGIAVVLVKVKDIATLGVGAAFWALVALVVINVLSDKLMCRLTLWRTLERRSRS